VIRDIAWPENMGLYYCKVQNSAGSDVIDVFIYPVSRPTLLVGLLLIYVVNFLITPETLERPVYKRLTVYMVMCKINCNLSPVQ